MGKRWPSFPRQHVTMGFKKGHTVLLHYQGNETKYQGVLFWADSLPGRKGGDQQHKIWKHVTPRHSEFAWLPSDLATTFCANALELEPQRAYGTFIHTLHLNSFWQTQVTIDQLYLIGDTRSAHELEVFVSMPLERLRLGCGLQCTLPHIPLGPNARPTLFSAQQ